ncbi:MAG: D-2-hydroxyacid dehydrogenase [Flavobacteriales bacterium]|nr:D-2-hydroxyacid dehydrogenase [Flavobacteriales bacterium]
MKILANDGIANNAIEMLKEKGIEVVTDKVAQEELVNAINEQGFAGLLVRSATKVRKDLIDQCPGLKFIGRGGVGMDNIDVEYARSKGLAVENTPAASSQSVAELVMGHMFSLARGTYDSNRAMPGSGGAEFKSLKKKYAKGMELRGKTLGIIGFGRIGRSTATYAIGCGMNVIFSDLYVDDGSLEIELGNGSKADVNVKKVSLDELLRSSDLISIHIPSQDGEAVIGSNEFAKMKKGVRIVNAARGGVIDEDALLEALKNETVAAIALDVFENEPKPRKDILNHPKIALSPHIGAATLEAQDRIGIELAEKIIAYFGK